MWWICNYFLGVSPVRWPLCHAIDMSCKAATFLSFNSRLAGWKQHVQILVGITWWRKRKRYLHFFHGGFCQTIWVTSISCIDFHLTLLHSKASLMLSWIHTLEKTTNFVHPNAFRCATRCWQHTIWEVVLQQTVGLLLSMTSDHGASEIGTRRSQSLEATRVAGIRLSDAESGSSLNTNCSNNKRWSQWVLLLDHGIISGSKKQTQSYSSPKHHFSLCLLLDRQVSIIVHLAVPWLLALKC